MPLSKKDKLGLVLLTVAAIAAVSLLTLPQLLHKSDFDEVSLCPTESAYRQTYFIVDTTDRLSEREERNLIAELTKVKDSMELFERLSIHLISAELGGVSDPIFDKCSPPTGEHANPLIAAPRLLRNTYEAEFGSKLKEVISRIGASEPASQSPILESLADIANEIRRNAPVRSGIRIVIFSDMMQHTSRWSHYKPGVSMDFAAFRESELGQRMMMDFRGVDVQVLYLPRSSYPEAHRDFWNQLLTEANANWQWIPIP